MADRLYKQYDPEVLKKLQHYELEVLSAFDQICKEHGWVYFLHYGTLIGALRHKGFIPWDDDVDVAMPREDYEQFVAYCAAHPSEKYAYVDANLRMDYTKGIPIFYKKGTVFSLDDIGWKPGIGIDIFVYDWVSQDAKKRNKQIAKANFYRRLFYLCYRDPLIPFSGVQYYLAKGICKIARAGLKIFRLSPKALYRRFKIVSQSEINEKEEMTTFFSSNPIRCCMPKEQFEVSSVSFEGHSFYAPKDPDKILRPIYGDYMVIPPEEKRVNHCPEFLEFGEE